MNLFGIVCEYNPFHLGHRFLIKEARRRLGGDAAAVCVLSGDFVQRGEAAIFDKFTRAEAACRAGADLVVELPLPWCLSSAEGFAAGAVSILDAMGCEALAFGSESGDREALERLASWLCAPEAETAIHRRMDADPSLSFARARLLSAEDALGDAAARLNSPNDILGIEYLKAVQKSGSGMRPLAVRRQGVGHDSMEAGAYRSAMQLRELFRNGEDPAPFIPAEAMAIYRAATAAGRTRREEALNAALLSRLYLLAPEDFDKLPDAGGGAGRRLWRALQNGGTPEEIARAAQTKRYTVSRMRRMLLCAALGICAHDTKETPPYVRVLAANGRGRAILASLRGAAPIPLVTRPAELKRLGGAALRDFILGADAHALYRLQFVTGDDRKRHEDWKKGVCLV